MIYLAVIAQTLIFPGLLFTGALGLVTSWVDRKVTALVQMRVGPPFLQPFYDLAKLMIKETCVPAESSAWLFLAAPLVGLAGVTAAATIIWHALLLPRSAFVGDLVVLVYLLALPSLGVILGAFASRNPLASLGGSREMKLVMAYELPFALAVLVPVIHAHSFRPADLLAAPAAATHLSGALALLVAVLCTQAKLTLVPFDMPEAETELTGGVLIEYSGPPLAMFKLTRAMMLFTMPLFLVLVFAGGFGPGGGAAGVLLGALKWLGLVVVTILIRNTAPRVRADQALKFFWGPATVAALFAVGLALRNG